LLTGLHQYGGARLRRTAASIAVAGRNRNTAMAPGACTIAEAGKAYATNGQDVGVIRRRARR
jgi:hypothetical protein